MLRQVSSRKGRAKGPKLAKAFQILLLLVVTVWFLFQIKHFYEKSRSFDSDSLNEEGDDHVVLKLGRKDLVEGEAEQTVQDPMEEDVLEDFEETKLEGGKEDNQGEQDQEREYDEDDFEEEFFEKEDQENVADGSGVLEDEEVGEDGISSVAENDTAMAIQGETLRKAPERGSPNDNTTSTVSEPQRTSLESREKNFQGDNASSAVGHNAQHSKANLSLSMIEDTHEVRIVKNLKQP